jgi:hypothetical protein
MTKSTKSAPSKRKETAPAPAADKNAGSTGSQAASKASAPRKKTGQTVKADRSPREVSKADQVLKLLRRKAGASIPEIQKAIGWQSHSVRGFLSGTVKKRMKLALKSVQPEKGDRRYSVAEA